MLSSIIDGRLFTQAKHAKDTYEQVIYIIEGSDNIYALRDVNPSAIRGALMALAMDFNIAVLHSANDEDTAEYIYAAAKRAQEDKNVEIKLRTGKFTRNLPEAQQFIVESLPNVGPTLAKQLLRHFGSVKAIVNASEEELREVEKIGEKKAKEIRKVLDAIYNPTQ